MIRKDISVEDWLSLRYNGKPYLVAIKSLIRAWEHEENLKKFLQTNKGHANASD